MNGMMLSWHVVVIGKHGSIRELHRAIGVNIIAMTEPDFNG